MVRWQRSTAKHICGPFVGYSSAPGHDGKSRVGSQSVARPPEGQSVLSARPHAGPTGSHPRESAVQREESGGHLLDLWVALEGTLVAPDPPSDSSDAIGEGYGGDVMAAGLGGSDGPGLELIRLVDAVSCEESGTGAVDEEHAGVGIPALGDAADAAAKAG